MAIAISGVNNNDRITASDGTIDLLSGVNYAGIITAPVLVSGNITAGSIRWAQLQHFSWKFNR